MSNLTINKPYSFFLKNHSKLTKPADGSLCYRTINGIHNLEKHSKILSSNSQWGKALLTHTAMRVFAVAIPILALVDVIIHSSRAIYKACLLKPQDAKYEILHCGKALLLFMTSVLLTPLSLCCPGSVNLKPCQTNSTPKNSKINLHTSKPTSKAIKKAKPETLSSFFGSLKKIDFDNYYFSTLNHFAGPNHSFPRKSLDHSNSLHGIRSPKIPEVSDLPKMLHLNISCNDLASLPPGIGQLTQLKSLNLSCNSLSSLPNEIGMLHHLMKLNLWSNKLTEVPHGIGMLSELLELRLGGNKLSPLSPSDIELLTKLDKLAWLSLMDTDLTFLPPEIGQLTQLKRLELPFNKISTLPPEIGQLNQLTWLGLYENKLTELPPEIGQLNQLTWLGLYKNKLTELPPEIGQLTSLEELFSPSNLLTSLPPEIGQLTSLQKLKLADNKLLALPAELGQLHNLKELDVSNNSNLTELPLSLGQIPALIEIDIEGTGISEEQRDIILEQCKALRKKEAQKVILNRLKGWQQASGGTYDFSEVLKWEKEKIEIINEWLVRLENTKDFKSAHQKGMANSVCGMLEDASKNEQFQKLFFSQVESNLECCKDRAAMALNEIYTAWKLTLLDKNTSTQEKLLLMARGAKTLALRGVLSQLIDKHQKETGTIEKEAVEIYLYYETQLKKKLNLLTAIENMAYDTIGKKDWIDENHLIKAVENQFLDHLIELPMFENMVVLEEDYDKEYGEKIDPIDNKIYGHLAKEPKHLDKLSEQYLSWQSELGKMQKERDLAVANLKKAWVKKRLKAEGNN